MKAVDDVGVTFVNTVLGRGILNGVVNVTLGVCLFTPNEKDNVVDPDTVVASRLRMDETCARNLYATLGDLLALIDKAKQEAVAGVAPVVEAAAGKLN